MHQYMKKIISLLLLISLTGCEKSSYNPAASLIGRWRWINTCGLQVDGCSTPESTRQNIELVFTKDSTYRYYVNDTLKETLKFTAWPNMSSGPGPMNIQAYVIKWDDQRQELYTFENSYLIIWDGGFNGLVSHYSRIN